MTSLEDSPVTYEQLADIEREFEEVETEIREWPFIFHTAFPYVLFFISFVCDACSREENALFYPFNHIPTQPASDFCESLTLLLARVSHSQNNPSCRKPQRIADMVLDKSANNMR